ncbi:MAG: serine/threonine protein kinase [Spirochaetales bacterium]|nr:serine/threonine protein kinase [Spirochaetales bacterium]
MAKIPEQIDKYQIEKLIATGGMGAVFKGLHPTLERSVILKKLTLRGNTGIRERFKREARILMDFRNDNIVDVQDHFVVGRSHYIVMEFVDGQSVKELLDEQRYLDNSTAAYIILHTAKALAYAHTKGVVHRDIKPGNILISRNGEVKLADFGIASSRDLDPEEADLTTDGMTLGTPAYMAPEQFENSRTVDYRADIYSLGVMFYEMLVGLKPFPGGFSPETIRLIQKGRYKHPRKINPTVSPELQKIVVSLIRPRPESRCNDIAVIIKKLEAYLGKFNEDDVQARVCALVREEPSPPIRPRKYSSLKLYIGSGIIVLILAGLLTGYLSITGGYKRVFKPAEYGQIRLLVDSSIGRPVTQLFIDDGGAIPPVDRKIWYFPFKEGSRSLDLVLPAGNYRAKTTTGVRVIWSSFVVAGWEVAGKTTVVHIGRAKGTIRPLEVSLDVHDAETGWDLMAVAELEVFKEEKFQTLDEAGEILSGRIHRFRISAPGYLSQEYSLKIISEESILHFQVDLRPEMGAEKVLEN